jgi:hypothetical protein
MVASVIDEWHDTTIAPATARMSRMVPTNVGSTSGVPEIANALLHRAGRQKIRSHTKFITETVLTETTDDDRVVRTNARGNSNNVLFIYDGDWNLIEGGAWKYEPSQGTGNPSSLTVGSESTHRSQGLPAAANRLG